MFFSETRAGCQGCLEKTTLRHFSGAMALEEFCLIPQSGERRFSQILYPFAPMALAVLLGKCFF